MTSQPYCIEGCPPSLRREALELVFAELLPEERAEQVELLMTEAAKHDAALRGLLCARAGARVVGAVLAQVHPGRTAAVWPPRVAPAENAATAHALMAAACHWLRREGVVLAQTLLAEVTAADRNVLEKAGFTHLAQLLYLVAPAERFPQREPGAMLQFVPARTAGEDCFAAIVEATYEDTRDCAGLDGVRPMKDVLTGYRAVGQSGEDAWFLLRHAGRDVGCLILADHPRQGNLELVYMGVLPEWRGRGWGIEVAQWAQWRARILGRERLVLAVDAENGPALAAYVAAGFGAWDDRSAYICVLGT